MSHLDRIHPIQAAKAFMRGGVKNDCTKDVKNDCTKDVKPCFTVARIEEQPREGDEGAEP